MKRYQPAAPTAMIALAAAAMTVLTMTVCVVLPASVDAVEQGADTLVAVIQTVLAHKEKS